MNSFGVPYWNYLSYRRKELLQEKYKKHNMLGKDEKQPYQIRVLDRELYNARKNDVHAHRSSLTNLKHFLRIIKRLKAYRGRI